jgi:serine/threonine protein kinase
MSVLTEIIDLYVSQKEEIKIRMATLLTQQGESTCGLLALAANTEIITQKVDPSQLGRLEFDEGPLGRQWLAQSIQSGEFKTPCPRKEMLVGPGGPLGYTDYQVSQDTVKKLMSESVDRIAQDERVVEGTLSTLKAGKAPGTAPGAAFEPWRTSLGQEANKRICTGCVVQLGGAMNYANGNWVVSKLEKNRIQLTPWQWNGLETNIFVGDDCELRVIGPPSLRSLGLIELAGYAKKARSKLMFVYPVKAGMLSNFIFAKKFIQEYTVIETLPCVNRFDIDCLLKLMEGKTVNLQVRTTDLFPVACLSEYLKHRSDIGAMHALYQEVLASLFDTHEITMETDPFALSRANEYPPSIDWKKMGLPRFVQTTSLCEVVSLATKPDNAKYKMRVILPDFGTEKNFVEETMQTVRKWTVDTVSLAALPSRPVALEFCPLEDPAGCLFVYVHKNKILKYSEGQKLSNEQCSLMKRSANLFVSAIHDHFSTVQKQPDPPRHDWSHFTHSTWGSYSITLTMEGNSPVLVELRAFNAIYNPINTQAVVAGGLLSYGGQKLVLSGVLHEEGETTRVVIYQLRRSQSDSALKDFKCEMMIMKALSKVPSAVSVLFTNTTQGWAIVERLDGTVWQRLEQERHTNKSEWTSGTAQKRHIVSCAQALATLHKRNYIHRDVKPENFLWDRERRICKIADFGFSQMLTEMNPTTKGNVGTLSYKAPEVYEGCYDQSADVYSFGITIWELLYGTRRYAELLRTMRKEDKKLGVSDLGAYMTDNSELLCTPRLTGGFGEAIDKLIESCTESNPKVRPNMQTVAEQLSNMKICRRTARQQSKIPNQLIMTSNSDILMDSQ